ncbi:hypothetical protein AgCh_028437 [Apium graveolens]
MKWNLYLPKAFHPLLLQKHRQNLQKATKEVNNAKAEFKGRVSGLKVKVMDTTGAGDAFVGVILNSLASEWNLYMGRMYEVDADVLVQALRLPACDGAPDNYATEQLFDMLRTLNYKGDITIIGKFTSTKLKRE